MSRRRTNRKRVSQISSLTLWYGLVQIHPALKASRKHDFGYFDPCETVRRAAEDRFFPYLISLSGESEWNKLNLFTGWKDPNLTDKGKEEALKGANELKKDGITKYDVAYTSALTRAHQTLDIILKETGQEGIETHKDKALNERDYGDLSGLNKDDARKKWGEEQVHIWRRSYDVPPPGGESLKMTAERTLPYYNKEILPRVEKGETVLVAAHGNSLRSIIMQIDGLSEKEVVALELATGVPTVYKIDSNGKVQDKKILK